MSSSVLPLQIFAGQPDDALHLEQACRLESLHHIVREEALTPLYQPIVDLAAGETFVVCYCDLDEFKPFNDTYGYRKGDEVIQITAGLLREETDPDRDFVGHIGGDDFIAVFRSPDWRERCVRVLEKFPAATVHLYTEEHLARGGYEGKGRNGQEAFYGLVSLSIGAVQVDTLLPFSSQQLAEFAAMAKAQAKKQPGNTLFVERRSLISAAALHGRL